MSVVFAFVVPVCVGSVFSHKKCSFSVTSPGLGSRLHSTTNKQFIVVYLLS